MTEPAARTDGVEVVTIATPNNTHYEIAKAALQAGLHVICEKPLCFTTAEAEELKALARTKGRVIGVTYGYSCYQTIEEARALGCAAADQSGNFAQDAFDRRLVPPAYCVRGA